MNKTSDILDIVRVKGINVSDHSLAIKFGVKYHAALGGAGKATLSDKQLAAINEFVNRMI